MQPTRMPAPSSAGRTHYPDLFVSSKFGDCLGLRYEDRVETAKECV
jgi:hypothetical protein